MDDCLFCRGPLKPHCPEKTSEKTCSWRWCTRCKVTWDPERMRVTGQDGPRAWPHTQPTNLEPQTDNGLTGEAEA